MKYALAYCTAGMLGLITSDAPSETTYADGEKGQAWTGLQVTGGWQAQRGHEIGQRVFKTPGMPWSSRTPRIIARLNEEEGGALEERLRCLASEWVVRQVGESDLVGVEVSLRPASFGD